MDHEFSTRSELTGDQVTVWVRGDVDMATADLLYKAATPEGARRLTLDLTEVPFFDSAGIHTLIRLTGRFPDALSVVPSRRVRRVLEIAGLGDQPWLAP
ncbi:STAS domain-containing protein [Actinomycetes bacterium KLBMP 9797]